MKGCNVTYEVEPGSKYTWNTPNYPKAYPEDITCSLEVKISQQGVKAVLFINDGYIYSQRRRPRRCPHDYLSVTGETRKYCNKVTDRMWTVETANVQQKTFTVIFLSTSADGNRDQISDDTLEVCL
ncbi:putative CUB domain-containing protein-like 18 [Homarus americanus]|uniref:Putative CUB domain-containing protein-like 18 n=1 Tax=Homarus americanus TaxID=6706 RepID=A0A8J5JM94_HOMAM|nr:putative CUB domain-containing protein-like 18 [Homarus americanus]